MKNVVFWTGIKNMKPNMVEKYGGYEWMDISKKSWEYWCNKNDCIFYQYDTPSQDDLKEFRVTWQRWFDVYDELERNNIDYDKIFLVDACSIVKWDCPNFFELTDDRMTAWLDKDNWGWIYQSVVGYKEFFKQFNHDISDRHLVNNYINAGAVIINKNHKEFFKSLKDFYYDNKDKLVSLQDKEVIKGTDQTPFNYWLQINNVEVNTSLPFLYNLTHMHRKSMFMYNWQLEEDKTPYFIKYGYVWKYNGIPKNERTNLMKQTWDIVKNHYVDTKLIDIDNMIDNMPEKKDDNNTTSKKFKKDLYNFISTELDYKNMKVLELGTSHGYTTGILASLFEEVNTCDNNKENIKKAKKNNEQFPNINYYFGDVYVDAWPSVHFDTVFVDCMHWSPMVAHDIIMILNSSKGRKVTVFFDDYGVSWGPNRNSVKMVVDWFVENGYLKVVKEIGHKKGTQVQNSKECVLNASEGLICRTLDKSTKNLGKIALKWVFMDTGKKILNVELDDIIGTNGLGDRIKESDNGFLQQLGVISNE